MAKRNKQSKKHRFKYAGPSSMVQSVQLSQSNDKKSNVESKPASGLPRTARPAFVAAATTRDFAYVGTDIRRIGIFATILVMAELLLWWLFGHTGLGNVVYQLIKV